MRSFIAALFAATAVAALAALAPGSPAVTSCAAAGAHHARLVVQHGDGSVTAKCVAFDGAQVTGVQLLNSSGVAWSGETFGGFGEAVCAIASEPAQYATCPGKDNYWAVFVSRGGGAWQLANVGISTMTLADGDAEGFRYVPTVGTPAAPTAPGSGCAISTSGPTTVARTATTSAPPATAGATDGATNGATDEATAGATDAPLLAVAGATSDAGSTGGTGDPAARDSATGSRSGMDLGLLAASVAGGGLLGLAMLRLLAKGRART